MTPRQHDIYLVIQVFWERFGYSPSIDEVMRLSGDKSRSNVARIINELCKVGALKKVPNMRRTVRPANISFRNIHVKAK